VIRNVFVTGTGTDVGKTRVTAGLVSRLRDRGVDAIPVKPVQTGALRDARGGWHAPDIEYVLASARLALDDGLRAELAFYLFEPACSPHLAARLAGKPILVERIVEGVRRLETRHGALIVEGAGGILVPLGPTTTMLDLAVALALPVLLVAHAGLGTINHTLLSLAALRDRGVPVVGVVLNETREQDPATKYIRDDNARTIEEMGAVRIVARIPFLPSDERGDAALKVALEGVDSLFA